MVDALFRDVGFGDRARHPVGFVLGGILAPRPSLVDVDLVCAFLAEAEALSVRVRLGVGGFEPLGGLQRRLSWRASNEVARFAVGPAQCEVSLVIRVTCHGFHRSMRTEYRPYDKYISETTAS